MTLTDIAAGIGMHKSTMLRYFETREEILLRLAQQSWTEWATTTVQDLRSLQALGRPTPPSPGVVAATLASTLVQRPLFCDLLAHVPLSLEHGVSPGVLKEFKLAAIAAADQVATTLREILDLPEPGAQNVVATATAMGGALWQMAAPRTELQKLYQSDPDLAHAIIDVEPRLTDILTALMSGYTTA